jgi:Domain of unknown function (DUF4129)
MPAVRLGPGPVPRLRPDPHRARAWLEDELARREYHQSVLDRLTSWLGDQWHALTTAAGTASGLSTAAAVGLAVLLVAVLALVAGRVRREPARRTDAHDVRGRPTASPEDHRRAAADALDAGHYDAALVEAYRAVVTRAVQRGVLEDRPGLTAHEVALEVGPVYPDHRAEIEHAAWLFDAVLYGEQPPTAEDARRVLDLDEDLRLARPAAAVR